MTYRVVLLPSEEGFAVSCPGVPGCWSQGASEQEALENIRDAIREYLEAVTALTRGQVVREVEVKVGWWESFPEFLTFRLGALWRRRGSAFYGKVSTS